ncbi:MAG: nitrilase-related carbon-nitrogen hydrolase [Gammaproteobacteria bacterium]
MTTSHDTIAYRALALQTRCDAVNGLSVTDARAQMRQTIERIGRQIASSKTFVGQDLKLVVLPEYFLTSFPTGETIEQWQQCAALRTDGPEYDQLGALAQKLDVYLCGNVYEVDDAFDALYFQTSFIISPAGDVVLRYRRLVSMFAPTPHDVWDRYLDVHGFEAVFPVVETPLGRLAAIASEEILYPEIARAFALQGAEVLLHSTSEVGSPTLTPKDIAKRARAVENAAYVVSANSAGIVTTNDGFPASSTDGMSKIVDSQGVVMVEAGYGESMVANAELNISALRRWRRRPGMGNVLSRQRLELFRPVYEQTVHAANAMLDADGNVAVPERSQFVAVQRDVIERLVKAGRL